MMFFLDMVVNFNITIPKNEDSEENDDRHAIAKDYLTSWFLIDIGSITPFDMIFLLMSGKDKFFCPAHILSTGDNENFQSAQGFTRILRGIKLFRMIKLLRLMKSADRLQSSLGLGMRVNSGLQRLGMLVVTILYVDHLLACFWILIGRFCFNTSHDGWLTPSIDSLSP